MEQLKKYLMKFKRWRVRRFVREYRKKNPKFILKQTEPQWGGGAPCEVLRNVRTAGRFVRRWTNARIDQVNNKTIWVRFADGHFGKFRKPRVIVKG